MTYNNHSCMESIRQKTEQMDRKNVNKAIELSQVEEYYHNRIKGKNHEEATFK